MYNKKRDSRFCLVNKDRILSKSKRSQSEIITTVLIILLVLAAIVIVWQVVRSTVTTGANQITGGTDCITISLDMQDVVANATGTFFKIKRNAGSGNLDKIVTVIDGSAQSIEIDASGLDELETLSTKYIGATALNKVEIAAKLGANNNNKLCDIADTYLIPS